MIDVKQLLGILTLHFMADFICQSNYMEQNKSSSNKALGLHILVYSVTMSLVGFKFAIINGVLHFGVDYITSRITKRLWTAQRVHDFFVIVGFDQLLHSTMLILTFVYLRK